MCIINEIKLVDKSIHKNAFRFNLILQNDRYNGYSLQHLMSYLYCDISF